MKTLSIITLFALAVLNSQAADVITVRSGSTYTLGSNDVVEVIATGDTTFLLNGVRVLTMATASNGGIVSQLPVVITGSSNTIGAQPIGLAVGFTTFRLRTKAEFLSSLTAPSVAISSAVVIPEDAAGPVTIVMESSTDLVTWVAANPGTYGASTPRRFFRVRAIQN